jgi:RsiW-degrading membrane proteinase PrsW (M82 family)
VETIIYTFVTGDISLIFYRSMVSIPVHLVASGIFGYFYGLSHFAKSIVSMENGEKVYGKRWLPKVLTLKRSVLYREEKIIEGILFATLFHAVMNLLFELSLGFLGVPLITGGIWMIFRLYKIGKKESRLIALFLSSRKKERELLRISS